VDLTATQVASAPDALVNEKVLNRLLMMFHDIRSSMVSTTAALKLLGKGIYGDVGQPVQTKIQEIGNRMDKLINLTEEFVDRAFSKPFQAELDREMLDLCRDIVDPVLEELAEDIQDHQVILENRLAFYPEVISVKGNKLWLKSVFRNLLKNAINHGEAHGTITLDWEKQGNGCRLNVYNSGEPVPEELRSILFSNLTPRLRRAHGNGAGLGLGLHLSRDLVASQGGEMWYEPRTDGSNFVIALPNS
jgi:signal transduction histidine kinase